jgi:hypothetical protein
MLVNDGNNCIVDVSIGCVESLFRIWYESCSCYIQIDYGHQLSPLIFWACWDVFSKSCNATIWL